MRTAGRVWLVLALAWTGAAFAQDRPDESSMFGAPAPAADAGGVEAASGPGASAADAGRDVEELAHADTARDAFASGEAVENPLQIGGIFYQRGFASAQDSTSFNHTNYSLPLQVNGYMDARPNDRIRGFVLARLQYDPTLDGCSASTTAPVVNAAAPCPRALPLSGAGAGGNSQTASTSSAPTSFGTGTVLPSNPAVLLDQAWLKFDIERVVFVTVGKQHVKWGASRFWNPTDFLHTQRRDPLLPYDLRLGNNMVKFEIPWEATATNFYAAALFDNPQPASSLGQLGGAFRAETTLFGSWAVGAEAVLRNGAHPVIGADLSAPIGPFDVYAEAAYRERPDTPLYSLQLPGGLTAAEVAPYITSLLQNGQSLPPNIQNAIQGFDLSKIFGGSTPAGQYVQVSGGFNYQFAWKENRQAIAGVEYFFNRLGYTNSLYYPALIFNGNFFPFYTGRHYAAIYATAEGPDELKHTNYTFSNLANLSDQSFISRIDFSWRVLTYLTFEAYGDVHYGNRGGEFRFALDTPALQFNGQSVPPLFIAPPTFDLGVGLRIAI
jgi:hypothetical protein